MAAESAPLARLLCSDQGGRSPPISHGMPAALSAAADSGTAPGRVLLLPALRCREVDALLWRAASAAATGTLLTLLWPPGWPKAGRKRGSAGCTAAEARHCCWCCACHCADGDRLVVGVGSGDVSGDVCLLSCSVGSSTCRMGPFVRALS